MYYTYVLAAMSSGDNVGLAVGIVFGVVFVILVIAGILAVVIVIKKKPPKAKERYEYVVILLSICTTLIASLPCRQALLPIRV